MTTNAATIVVSDVDLFRLRRALRGLHPTAAKLLEAGLAAARVVPAAHVPRDVVAIGARVVFRDEQTRVARAVRVVLPAAADASRGAVSAASTLGRALLGVAVGAVFEWPLPSGDRARCRVLAVEPADEG